jgi:hypothetical protein
MPSLLAADSAARSVELKRMEAVARSFVVGVSLMVCTGRTPPPRARPRSVTARLSRRKFAAGFPLYGARLVIYLLSLWICGRNGVLRMVPDCGPSST